MKFYISMAMLLFAMLIATATRVYAASETDMNSIMELCDKNADHRIDREEYQMYLSETFFFVDTDKDGYLVMEEMKNPVKEMDDFIVSAADKNSDGRLSIYELCNAMHKDFEGADLDDDGTIDMDELKGLMELSE